MNGANNVPEALIDDVDFFVQKVKPLPCTRCAGTMLVRNRMQNPVYSITQNVNET